MVSVPLFLSRRFHAHDLCVANASLYLDECQLPKLVLAGRVPVARMDHHIGNVMLYGSLLDQGERLCLAEAPHLERVGVHAACQAGPVEARRVRPRLHEPV